MVFLWFSMVFYGFSVVFLWFFYGFRPPVALRTSLRLVDKHIIPSERFSDRAQYSWAKDNIQQGPELLVCAMVNDVQRLVVWISWIGTFHILSMKILGISESSASSEAWYWDFLLSVWRTVHIGNFRLSIHIGNFRGVGIPPTSERLDLWYINFIV